MYNPDKLMIQFKMGKLLTDKFQAAIRRSGSSRNTWVRMAILDYLQEEEPLPVEITAEELLNDRQLIQVRLKPLMVDMINEKCAERSIINRTTWLIDAVLLKLHRDGELNNGRTPRA